MSGTSLDFGGAMAGGVETDFPTTAQVIAVQVIDETAQGIVTHEGSVSASFVFSYNGATISFSQFQEVIADGALYAALAASSVAAASITWNN